MMRFLLFLLLLQTPAETLNETFWAAARAGDASQLGALLDRGADINAKSRYEMTALLFAANGGHLDAVKLLVARGADVKARDTFYSGNALEFALMNGHREMATFLLQHGSEGADDALTAGVDADDAALVQAALAVGVGRQGLETALAAAERQKRLTLASAIKAALDARPPEPASPAASIPPALLASYVGTYRNDAGTITATVTLSNGSLEMVVNSQPSIGLTATSDTTFRATAMSNLTVTFGGRAGLVESMAIVQGATTTALPRVMNPEAVAPASTSAPSTPASSATAPAARTAARDWSSFRGNGASGNGDGQGAVTEWDVDSGRNIKWKTSIPGIADSSPIVVGARVFVTTAVSKGTDKTLRTGLYGDVAPVNDLSDHEWKIYCLDKASGKIVWERTAFSGAPKVKRHPKASQANSTPASDGRRVVAMFGSVGQLVAWDVNGKELWRNDLGVLDSGWFLDPTYQWGHGSSPVIYRNSVIVQADRQKSSYLAAFSLDTGKPVWKIERGDEISTWGTPAIVRTADGRDELVTNGTKVRGYDPATGALRWTLGPNSEITIATPVSSDGLVFVTGGYPPVRPIYAIRAGSTGDISLAQGAASSAAIAWSNSTEGTYIPTPIVYRNRLITLNVNGIVTAYDARTGARAFRGRVGTGGAFSASPIAADGRLYIASEDGEISVVTAEADLKVVAKNDMKEVIMATPAISDGLIVVRTLGHVYGIGR